MDGWMDACAFRFILPVLCQKSDLGRHLDLKEKFRILSSDTAYSCNTFSQLSSAFGLNI